MDSRYYYGEISAEGTGAWNHKELSPFDVLVNNKQIEFRGNWIDFLVWARRNLHEEVQVDWGSFVWKCSGKDLRSLKESKPDCEIESFDEIEPESEYGVVFIEMS